MGSAHTRSSCTWKKASPSCSRHGTGPRFLWKHQLPPKESLGFPAWAARKSPAGTQGCPRDEHMFNNPEIRAPKPSLAWPGPLLSPGAHTTKLFLKTGTEASPGGLAGMGGAVFLSLGIAKQRADPLDPLLSQAQGEATQTPARAWILLCQGCRGHRRGTSLWGHRPAPDTCCRPSRGGSSICQPVYPAGSSFPAGFCTLHMEGQAMPPPRVTSGSHSASSASNTIFWRFQGCRRKLFPIPV